MATTKTIRSKLPKALALVLSIALLPACGGLYLYDTVTPRDSDGDGILDVEERRIGTSEFDADTDGDGLYDDEELYDYATDPLRHDTDGDELWDGEEVFEWYTDPLHWDSDGDGIADGREVFRGSDPLRFNRY